MDDRPPPNAELDVEPSPALVLETGADTPVDSAPLSTETTAESVALSTEATTNSSELSNTSADDSSTKIEDIPISRAEGNIELATENTSVVVNLAVDNEYGKIEVASDGPATKIQSTSDPNETGAKQLLTECVIGLEGAHCRSSEAGLVDVESDSDLETVNLATDSAMAMEEKFGDNIDGVVDFPSDEDLAIDELETERSEELEKPSETSNMTLRSANDDSSTNGNGGHGPDSGNNVDGSHLNGHGSLENSNGPNNSMGPRLNGPNDTLGPRSDGGPTESLENSENENYPPSTDGERTENTRGEGDAVQGVASNGPRLRINRSQPRQARAWVRLLSPQWIALLLSTWEASLRQINTTMRTLRRQILAKWWFWNPVLIPLISGRGSACCPRSLMIGMSTRACVPLAERRIIGGQNAGGDTLSVTVQESSPHVAIDILGSEYNEDQTSLWSGLSGSSSASSWETLGESSEQSSASTSCSDILDEFSDEELEDVALNPKPIIDAPAEDLENVDENEVCKVCYSRRIVRKAFGPCGHAQLCAVCISGYKPRHHCPICRRRIDMILNIY